MKKLMKKKVNVFGKAIPVFAIVLMSFAIVSAALVGYVSNTITVQVTVESPLQIDITEASTGVVIDHDLETYTANLLGGQSLWIKTALTNKNTDDDSPLVYTEIKVEGVIDTLGMTLTYNDASSGDVVVLSACNDSTDSYYYIGPAGGFILPANTVNQMSTITLETAPNLAPGTYTSTTSVVLATDRKCIL